MGHSHDLRKSCERIPQEGDSRAAGNGQNPKAVRWGRGGVTPEEGRARVLVREGPARPPTLPFTPCAREGPGVRRVGLQLRRVSSVL